MTASQQGLPVTHLTLSSGSSLFSTPAAISTSFALLRLSWRGTTATTEATTELWVEATGSHTTFLITIASLATTVLATVTITSWASTSGTTWWTVAITTHHAAWWSVRALLLDVGLWDDFGGKVEPFAEVVEALWGEGVVVPLPGELGLEVAAGGEGLAGFYHLCRMMSVNLCDT